MHLVQGNETDTCPNIEVEIDVEKKSPFLIRPYHIKDEDKTCQRN